MLHDFHKKLNTIDISMGRHNIFVEILEIKKSKNLTFPHDVRGEDNPFLSFVNYLWVPNNVTTTCWRN